MLEKIIKIKEAHHGLIDFAFRDKIAKNYLQNFQMNELRQR